MPLPLTAQERLGQILEMLPAFSRPIQASAGREQMQVRVILPMAPMGVEHCDGAPPEPLAPDGALEVIQALCPTAPERTPHDRGVVVKGRAEQRGDRQEDVPRDHPRVEDLAHLTDPVVDRDFRAAQA